MLRPASPGCGIPGPSDLRAGFQSGDSPGKHIEQHLDVRSAVSGQVGVVLRGLHHDLVRGQDRVAVGDHPDGPGVGSAYPHDLGRSVALEPRAEVARGSARLESISWQRRLQRSSGPAGRDYGPQVSKVVLA